MEVSAIRAKVRIRGIYDLRFESSTEQLPRTDRRICCTLCELTLADSSIESDEPQADYCPNFFDFVCLPVFLADFFLGGRPNLGIETKASTSERKTSFLPPTETAVSRPRLIKSPIACFDTPRIRVASA